MGNRRTLAVSSAPHLHRIIWIAAFAALAAFVGWRMGLAEAWAVVPTSTGPVRLPNGFAGVDHPFHAVRAETLRRSLADGEVLRWVGHHQGGYPVEFYPLGAAWLAVGVWALFLGQLPMELAYAVSVWVILLAPGLAWVGMARRDRLPIGTAFLALAIHVAVPGAWWHGGYTELVQWGLVTNVGAAAGLLFALLGASSFAAGGRRRDGALAMVAGAAALLTNPRSALALAAIGVAVVVGAAIGDGRVAPTVSADGRGGRRRAGAGTASRAAAALRRTVPLWIGVAALAAPEVVALARFGGLYEFVRYSGYAGIGDWLASSVTSVSLPVFALALVGTGWGWVTRGRPATTAAAVALPVYVGLTGLVAALPEAGPLRQLEATRLMPFQRLLTIWLAAAVVAAVLSRAGGVRRFPRQWPGQRPITTTSRPTPALANVALVVVGVAVIAWWVRPGMAEIPVPGPPQAPERGLYPVERSGVPAQAGLRAAILEADRAAAPGSALLVLGSAVSWHQQLWAPLWAERPFWYDNWLWYWHSAHAGPPGYAFRQGHHYPAPERALAPDYLTRFGIGGVAATGPAAAAARSGAASAVPLGPLAAVADGVGSTAVTAPYGVWRVTAPAAMVESGGRPATGAAYANGRISAVLAADGEVRIAHNWFPRWRAALDGEPVPILRAADGTMRVPGGRAGQRLELVYAVDGLDWWARGSVITGLVGLAGWLGGFSRRGRAAPRYSDR